MAKTNNNNFQQRQDLSEILLSKELEIGRELKIIASKLDYASLPIGTGTREDLEKSLKLYFSKKRSFPTVKNHFRKNSNGIYTFVPGIEKKRNSPTAKNHLRREPSSTYIFIPRPINENQDDKISNNFSSIVDPPVEADKESQDKQKIVLKELLSQDSEQSDEANKSVQNRTIPNFFSGYCLKNVEHI